MSDVKTKTDTIEIGWETAGHGKVRAFASRGGERIYSDTLNPQSSIARKRFINGLCKKCPALGDDEVRRESLDDELLRIDVCDGKGDDDTDASVDVPDPDELLAEMPQAVRDEAARMLSDPELIGRIIEDGAALGVAGEHELVATLYLVGTSRLLERPLAAIVQGHTSSGKSYIIQRVASMFPDEALIHATHMTPQALYHMPEGALAHRFVVAGERARVQNDESADSTKALREMISEGWLVKQVPEKVDGEIVTVEKRVDGPIAYVESTTLTKLFEEDVNRSLLLNTDETKSQTRQVLTTLAAGYAGGAAAGNSKRIIEKHHAVQRMLRPCNVVVPFAGKLAEHFPTDRPEARRAFSHLMGTIIASALLHSRQRLSDDHGNTIATANDYLLAKRLLDGPLAMLLGRKVSDAAMRMLERLKSWAYAEQFTSHDVGAREHMSSRAIRGHLNELYNAGHVELVEANKGPKGYIWELTDEMVSLGEKVNLPDTVVVFGENFRTSDKVQHSYSESYR